MAEKIFVLEQSLMAANGSGLSHPLVSFTEEALAKNAQVEAQNAFKKLMSAHLCDTTVTGGFNPIGMTVAQFLASAGIVSFKIAYYGTEPRGAVLLASTPLVRLQ